MTVFMVLLEGMLAFLSPCILPTLPVYLMYLAGKEEEKSRKTLVVNTLGFILGFTIVFVLLGATASGLSRLLLRNKLLVQRVSGVVILLFGLHYMGVLRIGFLNREKRFAANTKDLNFTGAMLFGMAFSFGWSPCIGTFLGSALMLAANTNTIFSGVFLLFVFSMGLGIPFFLATLIFDQLKGAFDFVKRHFALITKLSGVFLVAIGLAYTFDLFKYWAGLFL